MKRNKITAVILSIVMSMSLMMPSVEVLADEASAPSETQKTETVETEEPKATEKQTPKETEKQEPKETEKSEPTETEKQEPKETEKQEPAESDETQITETAGSDEKEPAESKDNADNPEESNETAVVEGNIPSQSVSTPKKNAVTGTCGDQLTWSLSDDGVLSVSGNGKMYDWGSGSPVPWKNNKESITKIVISDNVTSIGSSAFSSCTSLTSITIPNSITSIGDYAFNNCTLLSSIDIPNSVTSIGRYAFNNCTSLSSVDISNSVTKIGNNTFSNCTSLTSITIPNSVTSIDAAFTNCTSLTSITIPNSVTSIDGTFSGCTSLASVTIPDSVTSIGMTSFNNCTSLTSITIPDSVTSIGWHAFYNCRSLISVIISDNASIGEDAFNQCPDIKSVVMNRDAYSRYLFRQTFEFHVYFYYDVFYSNSENGRVSGKLRSFYGDEVEFSVLANPGFLVDKVTLTYAGRNIEITPDAYGKYKYTMPDTDSVTISATFKADEYTVKVNNGNATPATAAAGTVITLTADAAPSGKLFDKWIVNSGTVSLSNASSSTTTFTMPAENVEVTATYKDVEYTIKVNNGSATPATATAGTVITLTADAAPSGKVFDKWIVNSGTVSLSNASSSTTTFTMPAENVGVTATYKAPSGTCGDNLTWTFEDGTLTISGSGKMTDWTTIVSVPWYKYSNKISSVVLSGDITSIGGYAFICCSSLTSITIPNSVTSIGEDAFWECTSLTSITIPGSVTSIGSGAFCNCTSLTSITIQNGVTSIGDNAFASCTRLTSITIPNSVTSIGKYAFEESGLTSITIPNGVTSIREGAFWCCESLTSITIPKSVKTIGESAFDACTGLKDVYYSGTKTDWKNIKIYSYNAALTNANIQYGAMYSITVNSGMSDLAKAAEGTTVTVNANAAPSGKVFDKWTVVSGDVTFANELSSTTTFTMPDENVEVTATYKNIAVNYSVKVNNGSATPATAPAGTVITLTADAAPSGKAFDKWIVDSGTVSFSNASSSTTTFTMPAENVEVTATYKDAEYTIKVNNGSATPATATAGTVITITADAAPSGKVFDKWIVNAGSVSLSNASSSTASFTMPAENVEVTATYKTIPSGNYIVKINNGVATPSTSAPGLVVNVKANDAPAGTEFEKWEVVSGTVIFADSSSAATFFVMPAENVEITAKYKSKLSVKGKTATVKYSKVKKKNQTLAVSKVLTFVDKGQGQLTYAKVSGNSKILINKTTGTITVKKKLKKKTYTVKVKVQASGDESCNPSGWKTVTFKIKVK